jgi:hypothetical protein
MKPLAIKTYEFPANISTNTKDVSRAANLNPEVKKHSE